MKLLNRLLITIMLSSLSINALAIDYPLAELIKFQYFRYPTSVPKLTGAQQQVESQNIFKSGTGKIKAVFNYFREMMVGSDWLYKTQTHVFDPDAGKRNSNSFDSKFGYRGQNLIDQFGRPEQLVEPRNQLKYYEATGKNTKTGN